MRIAVPAHAKLNLGLEVLGRRADGLHDLCSVMVAIDLHELVVIDAPAGGGGVDEADLAARALVALGSLGGRSINASVAINKEIPAGGGLGGGSADAAAVLRAGPSLGVPEGGEALHRLAAELGADVPFQLAGCQALVEGVGERLTALPFRPLLFAVCWPGISCSTREVFSALRESEFSDGARVRAAAAAWIHGPDTRGLPNALHAAAERAYPELHGAHASLTAAGWEPRLTGSGGSFFQEVEGIDQAQRLAAAASALGYQAWVARSLP